MGPQAGPPGFRCSLLRLMEISPSRADRAPRMVGRLVSSVLVASFGLAACTSGTHQVASPRPSAVGLGWSFDPIAVPVAKQVDAAWRAGNRAALPMTETSQAIEGLFNISTPWGEVFVPDSCIGGPSFDECFAAEAGKSLYLWLRRSPEGGWILIGATVRECHFSVPSGDATQPNIYISCDAAWPGPFPSG